MTEIKKLNFDLEERSFQFAKRCRDFVKTLPKTMANLEYAKQLLRSSSSPAANYIEANESLSKKDFVMRIKICRKESKESRLWLRLCETGEDSELIKEQNDLIKESRELMLIFNSIVQRNQ